MTQNVSGGPPAGKRGRPSFNNLGRAIRFLGHYRGVTILAYLALFLSTGAQLMVPQMVQNVLDSITDGMMVQQTAGLPPDAQAAAMATIGMTAEQYQQTLANPYAALYWSIASDPGLCRHARPVCLCPVVHVGKSRPKCRL